MHARRTALLLGALLGLLACGSRATPAPEGRVRLWLAPTAELQARAPDVEPPAQRFSFETLGDWRPLSMSGAPAPEVSLEREDETPFVRLHGAGGGLHLALPVEPDTCYEFVGEVRAALPPTLARPFLGATFWLGEARDDRPLEECLAAPRERLESSRLLPTVAGHAGWQTRRRVFVTGTHTRVLHLVCSLSERQPVPGATVDFRALALAASPLEAYARRSLLAAQARRAASDPPASPWQAQRRLGVSVGDEFRPGFVLLPGDRLRFPLPPAPDGWTLRFLAAPFEAGRTPERAARGTLLVRSGAARLAQEFARAAGAGEPPPWAPFTLTGVAGTLEFELEGELPLALGTPELVRPTSRAPGPNVLLVSIDTLRADFVGPRAGTSLTPHLDALAARGLVARDACSVAPYTLPTHTTMLTGQLPSVHGVVAHENTLSAARSTTLAERLAAAGYATRAFTAGGFVNPEFGLDRGFDAFATIDPVRAEGSHYARTLAESLGEDETRRRLATLGFEGVRRWLGEVRDERFFLFLHTYAVHDYDAPESYLPCHALGCPRPAVPLRTRSAAEAAAFTPEMRAHVQHLYAAALRYTDERLGALLDELERLGLLANTLVLVTSDHGEEFFEHGQLQHGLTLHEELLRVPLILAGPGVPARELTRPAQLTDLAPTLLARLGLPPLSAAQGVDLLGPQWPERILWAEVDDRFAHQYALRREDGRKTLHAPQPQTRMFPRPRAFEHYDLARDPHEQHELALDPAWEGERRALEAERARLEDQGRRLGAAGSGTLDAETESELEHLGYGGD